jgi:hypothetical protein
VKCVVKFLECVVKFLECVVKFLECVEKLSPINIPIANITLYMEVTPIGMKKI